MAQPSDHERLTHILEAIGLLIDFVGAMEFDEFLQDRKTQLSIERLLEIIGEAANHLSQELKERYPQMPWRPMTDLRNVVSHEYFQLRIETVWQVVIEEVPPLKAPIEQILHDLATAEGNE